MHCIYPVMAFVAYNFFKGCPSHRCYSTISVHENLHRSISRILWVSIIRCIRHSHRLLLLLLLEDLVCEPTRTRYHLLFLGFSIRRGCPLTWTFLFNLNLNLNLYTHIFLKVHWIIAELSWFCSPYS